MSASSLLVFGNAGSLRARAARAGVLARPEAGRETALGAVN